jgi:hypothetical protein
MGSPFQGPRLGIRPSPKLGPDSLIWDLAASTGTVTLPPPNTTIGPVQPTNVTYWTTASFSYTADESPVTFEASLDSGSFASVPNAGKTYTGLSTSSFHGVQVRAINSQNTTGPAASYLWYVVNSDSGSIYVPDGTTGFSLLGLGRPKDVWTCQDTTGSATDNVSNVPMSASLNLNYRQTLPTGWSRVALQSIDGVSNAHWQILSGADDNSNPAKNSVAWLAYVQLTSSAPSAARTIVQAGGNLNIAQQSGLAKVRISIAGNVTNGTANYVDGKVHPFLLVYDRTNSKGMLYTDLEAITGTFGAGATEGNKGLAGVGGVAGGFNFAYVACFTGSDAEALGKQSLRTLGWTLQY